MLQGLVQSLSRCRKPESREVRSPPPARLSISVSTDAWAVGQGVS